MLGVIKQLSVAVYFLSATGFTLANPLTLYRIAQLGSDQPDSGVLYQAPSVTAIGVGPEGGTTYEQFEQFAWSTSTYVTGTPPVETTSALIGDKTDVFVQHASWAYEVLQDQSGFKHIELNCTLPAEGTDGSECIEVIRYTSAAPGATPAVTITAVSMFPGTLVGRFTATGPIPTAPPPPTATANGANVAGRDIGRRSWTSAMIGFAVLGAWPIAW